MADTYIGRVSNGVVILEGADGLPEGTAVRVEPIVELAEATDAVAGTRRMLLAWGRRAEAVAPPMPDDLAVEHDRVAWPRPRGHVSEAGANPHGHADLAMPPGLPA